MTKKADRPCWIPETEAVLAVGSFLLFSYVTYYILRYNLPEDTNIGFLICKYPDGYCNAATWHNDH